MMKKKTYSILGGDQITIDPINEGDEFLITIHYFCEEVSMKADRRRLIKLTELIYPLTKTKNWKTHMQDFCRFMEIVYKTKVQVRPLPKSEKLVVTIGDSRLPLTVTLSTIRSVYRSLLFCNSFRIIPAKVS